jgi:hypothetical protein
MDGITLRWIDMDEALGEALLAEAFGQDSPQEFKDKALAQLGITRAAGEQPLTAWLRVMAEENGLPVAVPAVPVLKDAVENTAGVMRFVSWLA